MLTTARRTLCETSPIVGVRRGLCRKHAGFIYKSAFGRLRKCHNSLNSLSTFELVRDLLQRSQATPISPLLLTAGARVEGRRPAS